MGAKEHTVNNLNSILLEGVVQGAPVSDQTAQGLARCRFTVASERFYKQGTDLEKEVSLFDVEAVSRLAQSCAENLRDGRGVRIVGRLRTSEDIAVGPTGLEYRPVVIVAEHVEFKPAIDRTSGADK